MGEDFGGLADFRSEVEDATPAAPVGLQVRNPGDLYLYSNNNLQAVKIKGSDLKAWLETRGQPGSLAQELLSFSSPKGILLIGVPGCGKSFDFGRRQADRQICAVYAF